MSFWFCFCCNWRPVVFCAQRCISWNGGGRWVAPELERRHLKNLIHWLYGPLMPDWDSMTSIKNSNGKGFLTCLDMFSRPSRSWSSCKSSGRKCTTLRGTCPGLRRVCHVPECLLRFSIQPGVYILLYTSTSNSYRQARGAGSHPLRTCTYRQEYDETHSILMHSWLLALERPCVNVWASEGVSKPGFLLYGQLVNQLSVEKDPLISVASGLAFAVLRLWQASSGELQRHWLRWTRRALGHLRPSNEGNDFLLLLITSSKGVESVQGRQRRLPLHLTAQKVHASINGLHGWLPFLVLLGWNIFEIYLKYGSKLISS